MTTNTSSLGRLVRVELREAWASEAGDFTPWLAKPENLALLGDAIGLELEVEATEVGVDPYKADILCKNVANGDWVVIENQLEQTDHKHLGQLLTYAAGLDAQTAVWITAGFTERHRAVIDRLNQATDDSLNIFGIEIELLKIADSPPAPRFNVVCSPNSWSKSVRKTVNKPEDSTRLEFWTAFREHVNDVAPMLLPGPATGDAHLSFPAGHADVTLRARADRNQGTVGVVLRTPLNIWHQLQLDDVALAAALGQSVIGSPTRKGTNAYKLAVSRNADIDDTESWPDLHAWLAIHVRAFAKFFHPRLRALGHPGGSSDD